VTPRTVIAALCLATSLAAAPPAAAQTADIVGEVRIHGNYATPDTDVLRLAGISVGQPIGPGGLDEIVARLRQSGRFESVEIRKRFRSLTEAGDVALIIIVREHPGVEPGGIMPGPMKRLRNTMMTSPTLEYVDGYGVTGGGRVSFVNVFGKDGHLTVPMTVGSTRQAAVEMDKSFHRGPVRRLNGGAALVSRENPGYDERDFRKTVWIEGRRPFLGVLNAGARAAWTDVSFGERHERISEYGASLTLDTRVNPAFPRNAVFVEAGWRVLEPASGTTINLYRVDARGYLGVVRSVVLAVRALSDTADRPLPVYERALAGGISSLRGFRAGAFTGDNLAAGSVELRFPVHSPMQVGQAGVTVFGDAAAAYDYGTKLSEAACHYGYGAGWYLRVPMFQLNIDVAYGVKAGGARLHAVAALRF
jgi:outer membrane protein assembly factor BamA